MTVMRVRPAIPAPAVHVSGALPWCAVTGTFARRIRAVRRRGACLRTTTTRAVTETCARRAIGVQAARAPAVRRSIVTTGTAAPTTRALRPRAARTPTTRIRAMTPMPARRVTSAPLGHASAVLHWYASMQTPARPILAIPDWDASMPITTTPVATATAAPLAMPALAGIVRAVHR